MDIQNLGLLSWLSNVISVVPSDIVFLTVISYLIYEFRRYLNTDDEQALEHGPAELTTIGVIGTFIGISVGLAGFDVNDIDASVPQLLQGLKTAFLTSVAGIGAGLYIKRQKLKLSAPNSDSAEFTPDVFKGMFLEHLQLQSNLIEGMKEVAEGLSSNNSDSLSSLLSKIRNDLNDNHKQSREDMEKFVKELAEQSTKGIIETLEEVIRDFNNKIGEQFGENFARLETAAQHLNQWQQENKDQLSLLTETFTTAANNQDRAASAIQKVEQSTAAIPDHVQQLGVIMDTSERQLAALSQNLESFSDIRKNAEKALPLIHDQVAEAVKTMEEAVSRASGHYQTLLTDSRNMIDQFGESSKSMSKEYAEVTTEGSKAIRSALDGVADDVKTSSKSMHEAVLKSTNSMKLDIESVGEKMKDNISRQVAEIFEQFQKTEIKLKNLLSENWNTWDDAMQQEVGRLIKLMAAELTQVSGAFVQDYHRMLTSINDGLSRTQAVIEQAES